MICSENSFKRGLFEMVSHRKHCINLVPELFLFLSPLPFCLFVCLSVLFFYPFNLPVILRDLPHGKHTANATKIFYVLRMVFISKYLYLTSQV